MHVKRANVYISRCSAETAKINLMVFRFMLYCVVEPKLGALATTKATATRTAKMEQCLICKITTSLHDYVVKMLNFTFYGNERKQARTNFPLSF